MHIPHLPVATLGTVFSLAALGLFCMGLKINLRIKSLQKEPRLPDGAGGINQRLVIRGLISRQFTYNFLATTALVISGVLLWIVLETN